MDWLFYERGTEVYGRGGDFYERGAEVYERGGDFYERGTEVYERGKLINLFRKFTP